MSGRHELRWVRNLWCVRAGVTAFPSFARADVVAYAGLVVYSLALLALRQHRAYVLRVFVALSVALGILRLLEVLVFDEMDESLEAGYLSFGFLLSLSPALFIAQFALIVRTWADALYSVGDCGRRRIVSRIFIAAVGLTVVWQFLLMVVAPFTDVEYRMALVVHHSVRFCAPAWKCGCGMA